MAELIYSVQDVFTKYLKENEYYNIPEYQRGYKWNAENVKTMLDDFRNFHDNFIKSDNKDQFYCLQNITLFKIENGYNVVDGQQRLTTLLVLLSFLEKSGIAKDRLKYSIKDVTHQFICEQIITRKIWNSEIVPDKANTKDQYFLCDVAKAIKEWFEVKENKRKKFADTILNQVKVIVNTLEGKQEKIFSNLNGGQVSLDGADLIRAVLMTRAAKEKYNSTQISEQVNEFRVRMGIELDEMNLWWSDKDVKTFFGQIVSDKIKKADKKFNPTQFPINVLYMLYYESKNDKSQEFSFRFFEYGQDSNDKADDNHWEMYDEITKLHHTLKDWYNNREIYHYLGFLFFRFKSKISFSDVWKIWEEKTPKKDFELKLKNIVIENLLQPYQNEKGESQLTKDKLFEQMKNDIIDTKIDWYSKDQQLFNVLIIRDILHCLKSETMKRLNVEYFKPNGEDNEHIRSQTPKWEGETRNYEEWKFFIDNFEEIDVKKELLCILGKKKSDLTDEQLENIVKKLNEFGLNSIGNMALLDLRVNRSYGNSNFIDKKSVILEKYFSGTYIRPHTFYIFMKNDQTTWSIKNIEQNAESIATAIENWIGEK